MPRVLPACDPWREGFRRKGVRDMERMIAEGLALEELEAHAHAELLPDRIEMRQRKSSDNVTPQ